MNVSNLEIETVEQRSSKSMPIAGILGLLLPFAGYWYINRWWQGTLILIVEIRALVALVRGANNAIVSLLLLSSSIAIIDNLWTIASARRRLEGMTQQQPFDLQLQVLQIIRTQKEVSLADLLLEIQQPIEKLNNILSQLEQQDLIRSENRQSDGALLYRIITNQNQIPNKISPPYAVDNQASIASMSQWLSIIQRLIWPTVIVVVIVPLVGQYYIAQSLSSSSSQNSADEISEAQKLNPNPQETTDIDWYVYEQIIANKLRAAHQAAKDYSEQELQEWGDGLIERIDNNFLDWYFGYFNQKQIEYKSFFTSISSNIQKWLNPDSPDPQEKVAEQITQDFQIEFAKRVLHPSISQLKLERIAEQTSKKYLKTLKEEFNQIPFEIGIKRADWQRYLSDVSVEIPDVKGNIIGGFPLGEVTTAGGYLAFKPAIVSLFPKIGSKMVVKLSSKMETKIATKTASAIAGKVGSTLLDASVGAGIILWDIWDTKHSASIEKPIVRDNLVAYIRELQLSILEIQTMA